MRIGIVGYGYVGKGIEEALKNHELEIYDKYKGMGTLHDIVEFSDIIFVCLPTPYNEENKKIDLSIIDDAIEQIVNNPFYHSGKIITLKSTIVPGTTQGYIDKYPQASFAFIPEFLTEANYLWDSRNPDRIVIGSNNDWIAQRLIATYREMEWFEITPIFKMNPTAAEIVKYHANVLMATKVSVANVIYDICDKFDVKYEDVKKGVQSDHRIGEYHIDVTSERGFGGKCFWKDMGAFLGLAKELGVDSKALEEVFEYNLRIRKVRDWEEIAGASTGGRKYEENS